jgi:protein involved in polysaccharide export with SLBB domain
MTKLINLALSILLTQFIVSCSTILEPVTLDLKLPTVGEKIQEEFNINIEPLTFKNAKKINKGPYPRQVSQTGNGTDANVHNENKFLDSANPLSYDDMDYIVGYGDVLKFVLINEFINEKEESWPKEKIDTTYYMGIGDELTFTQLTTPSNVTGYNDRNAKIRETIQSNLINTKGIIGSNGNLLLLGIGNLKAVNKTLIELQTEVRNILIRNGKPPNFQLEITGFKSKKAFLTLKGNFTESILDDSATISINNLPISLQEIALRNGLSEYSKTFAQIALKRHSRVYRATAEQLFKKNAPEIFIQDNDQIEIETSSSLPSESESAVSLNGTILFPTIGKINVLGLTLNDIHNKIKNILLNKKIKPNFQLLLERPINRKAYFIEKNGKSKIINLRDTKTSLKEVIIQNASSIKDDTLSVVTLMRQNKTYQITVQKLLDSYEKDIWIQNRDQINIKSFKYKPGHVYALTGTNKAQIIDINPAIRETLADVLFTDGGALSNRDAKRSEVYLLRGKSPSTAYHLNTQNVSRILVAAKTELRPNDIIFVAERPIISFTRTLAEISPLRTLLRDLDNGNIP